MSQNSRSKLSQTSLKKGQKLEKNNLQKSKRKAEANEDKNYYWLWQIFIINDNKLRKYA